MVVKAIWQNGWQKPESIEYFVKGTTIRTLYSTTYMPLDLELAVVRRYSVFGMYIWDYLL